jgi:SAM-dependent methyltransferase
MGLREWLKLPEADTITDLDDPRSTVVHGQIIRKKPFLRNIYREIYRRFARNVPSDPKSVVVELGSGGGFIKQYIPHAITSDILKVPGLDVCFSAMEMPFDTDTLDAILMIDVLHHLPDVARFFAEAARCLKPGGKVLMVEPANTPWGRFIYRNFHHEPFEPGAPWELSGNGPMSSANGAIPWIVFKRDREQFERRFPQLRVTRFSAHTPVRYLVSGGVSMRQLMPSFMYPVVKGMEVLATPINRWAGMFYHIWLDKRGS